MSDPAAMQHECRVMQVIAPRTPLVEATRPAPHPAAGQELVRVEAGGVCRADLMLPIAGFRKPATRSSMNAKREVLEGDQ